MVTPTSSRLCLTNSCNGNREAIFRSGRRRRLRSESQRRFDALKARVEILMAVPQSRERLGDYVQTFTVGQRHSIKLQQPSQMRCRQRL